MKPLWKRDAFWLVVLPTVLVLIPFVVAVASRLATR